jgi:outer membrane protein OmpA-like peptidoglycan-associated protein
MAFSITRGSLFAGRIFAAVGAVAGAVVAMASPTHAACADLAAGFDRAVAAGSVDALSRSIGAIGADAMCLGRVDEFRARLSDFLIAYAGAPGVTGADREHAIGVAERTLANSGNWQGLEKLADYFLRNGDTAKAHDWYEQTVTVLNTPGVAPKPNAIQLQTLADKLFGAQSLLNDDKEGLRDIPFVSSKREQDGSLGGLYSPVLLRGAAVVKVSIPINFYTNATRFTPTGLKAMQLLAEVAKQQPAMTLVGHADPRTPPGKPDYNMELSRQRAMAVRDELLRNGVTADIKVDWKGASQPFKASLLPNADLLTEEDIWQLDRRVEWVHDALPK